MVSPVFAWMLTNVKKNVFEIPVFLGVSLNVFRIPYQHYIANTLRKSMYKRLVLLIGMSHSELFSVYRLIFDIQI